MRAGSLEADSAARPVRVIRLFLGDVPALRWAFLRCSRPPRHCPEI